MYISLPIDTVIARLNDAGCKPQLTSRGYAAICPAHADRNPSLRVEVSETGNVLLKCFARCPTKAIVEALGLEWGHLFQDGKPYRVDGKPVKQVPRPRPVIREPIPPVPDLDLLLRIMEHAFGGLRKPAAEPFLRKRGLSVELCQKWQVGFMPWIRFKRWKGPINNVWIIPIADATGKLCALKLHRENPPRGFSKGLWAPIGIDPAEKPRHGYATFWPPPETFDRRDKLYLLPGELKALAVLGTGRAAISITTGEGIRWTPGLLSRLEGRSVCIVWDDDKAGIEFREETSHALKGWVRELSVASFGRKVEG